MATVVTAPDATLLAKRAGDLAEVAGILASEASALALLHSGEGHAADVASRAAQQAVEASDLLRRLVEQNADPASTLQAATWALSAAAVAVTQAKLNTTLATPP